MTAFTKETEQKMRDLGQSLKLQFDFAKAADMTQQKDQLQFAQNNAKSALLMIDLIQELGISKADDAGMLEQMAKIAEDNGSDAGDLLKKLAPTVRAVNTEAAQVLKTKMQKGETMTGADLNGIFRKHLTP